MGQVMSLEEVTEVMDTLDTDGNGKLSLQEFAQWFVMCYCVSVITRVGRWDLNQAKVRLRTKQMSSTDINIIRAKCMTREMQRIYKVPFAELFCVNGAQLVDRCYKIPGVS